MGMFNILDISAAGMSVERQRLEVGVTNLANAQTTSPPGGTAYQPLEAIIRSGSPAQMSPASVGSSLEEALPRPFIARLAPMVTTPRRVYDPGHPDADAQGFVSYPGIDPVNSMMDLISVSRSYEANLKAFDITRSLLERTLQMGGEK